MRCSRSTQPTETRAPTEQETNLIDGLQGACVGERATAETQQMRRNQQSFIAFEANGARRKRIEVIKKEKMGADLIVFDRK